MTVIKPEPTNLKGQNILDVRVSSKLGYELAEDIVESVGHTQLFIQTTLPDVLLVTQKQFASLQDYTEEMAHTTDRMYITPYNVMEVKIDRDVDTVQIVEDAIVDTENLKKQGRDSNDTAHEQDTESRK
jgi:hypothetical protein